MSWWTAADIPDLSGLKAVVTGANSGLGYQTSLELARHGALVVMACRDQRSGQEAADRITAGNGSARLEVARLDLADLASVRDFATGTLAGHPVVDILINNAGVMAIPHRLTADWYEMQFGTNFLGHFALTGHLLPGLLAAPRARVVTLTSLMAIGGRIDFDNLQGERGYRRWKAYSQSKLADLLFALELDRRFRRAGVKPISVAAHPGYAATNLQVRAPQMEANRLRERVMLLGNVVIAQSAAEGALPTLRAATAGGVQGGELYGPTLLSRGPPKRIGIFRSGRDQPTAERLWRVAEDLTGVTFEARLRAAAPV